MKPTILRQNKPLLLSLAAGLTCAGLYVFAYGGLWAGPYWPGLGITVITWLLLAAGCVICRPHMNGESLFLTACALLLSGAYALFGSVTMKALNLPVLLFLTVQALMSLAGLSDRPALSPASLWTGLCRFLGALFVHWPVPFRALRSARGDSARLRGLGWGLLLAVLVLAVVLPLLISADAVFGQGVRALTQEASLENALPFLGKLLRTALLGMLLFSFLYALSQPRREMKTEPPPHRPALPFAVLCAALCAVYAAFVYVQFRYLFGGAETALLKGGYAQYARSGFFQLVAVALINLAVLGITVLLADPRGALRALCLLLTALTGVILVSSFWRMRLYILAYGLSTLRLLTLWAMAMITCALALTAFRLLLPTRRVFSLLAALILAAWVGLNYLNVDALIARYNTAAYAAGRLETADLDYLRALSPDVIPFLGEAEYPAENFAALPWFCRDASLRHLK